MKGIAYVIFLLLLLFLLFFSLGVNLLVWSYRIIVAVHEKIGRKSSKKGGS